MTKRKIKQIWVDRATWAEVERIFPDMKNPERSRWLYKSNFLARAERVLIGNKKSKKK